MNMSQENIDYPKGLTFEKVWATIQENHQKFQEESRERNKEFHEREKKFQDSLNELTAKYNDLVALSAKEKLEWQERQKQRKAYEEQRKEQRKIEDEKKKAEDEKQKVEDEKRRQEMKELGEYIRKTSRSIDKSSRAWDKKMGDLGNRFGELAEHLVAPNIAERFNELGYNFDRTAPHGIEIKKDEQVLTEVDLWLENTKTIAVVEVKAKPTTQDVNKHLKRMHIVRQNVEQHGDVNKSLIGAIAGAIFPDHVKQFAIEVGFYVITQSGDTVKIEVPKDFKPRIF